MTTETVDRTSQPIEIASAGLTARVDPFGAQLMSLRTAAGSELLWQGDPAVWPDRAPILFPVIGPVTGGTVRIGDADWPMPPHGFARLSPFAVESQAPGHCVLTLRANEHTRQHYPFAFVLRVIFDVQGDSLGITISVTNGDTKTMPADAGFHPGFQWPLVTGHGRDGYALVFPQDEPAPVRRGVDDPIFLTADDHPTPVVGSVLALRDELFTDNALVFDRLRSRSLTYGPVNGGPALRIAWPESPYLAIWSRPGAGFLAIEPWQGLPSPVGYTGPLADKPGIAHVAPGETREWRMLITWQAGREERA